MSADLHNTIISDLGKGLCVHAGAGSGKTKMLVDRYLQILRQGKSDPGRVVAITFTEKAAEEMKERVRKEAPDHDLSAARISTIHAFCTALLRQHPLEAGVDPNFLVLESVQASILLDKALGDWWQERMAAKDPALLELLEYLDPKRLFEFMESLIHARAMAYACRDRWKKIDRSLLLQRLEMEKQNAPDEKKLKEIQWMQADDYALRCNAILLDLLDSAVAAYEKAKAAIPALDFEDLQIRAERLLRNDRVRERIRRGIDFLLLDEFQDTDALQWTIAESLAPLHAVFVVGDPKQSIYGFRGTDVSVFRRMESTMREAGNVLLLDVNHRSVPGILDFCNDFFHGLFAGAQRHYEIPHQPMKPARAGDPATRSASPVAAWLHAAPEDPDAKESSLDELRRREAAFIAAALRKWKDESPPFPDFQWKDVAILFRKMGKAYLYERELEKNGIPFTTTSASAFYGQACVTDVLNALKAALNRRDDLALAGFLRSPMVGVSDETLYRLRKKAALWDAMQDELDPVLRQARAWLDAWHQAAGLETPSALLRRILKDTDYEAILLSQHMGERKVALVQKVLELAENFEQAPGFGMRDFEEYLRTIALDEAGDTKGPTEPESDTVSLLTVHKAKGLQYRAVIVADLCHMENQQTGRILFDPELGIGVNLKDGEDKAPDTLAFTLIKNERKRREAAEAKRVLYVAATRARDILVFSGLFPGKSRDNAWNRELCAYLAGPGGKKYVQQAERIPAETPSVRAIRPLPAREKFALTDKDWAFAMESGARWKALPQTLSVTQALELLDPGEAMESRDLWIPGEPLPANRIGSIAHLILSWWDFRNAADVPALLDRALEGIVLSPEEKDALRLRLTAMLEGFAQNPCAEGLRRAKSVLREIPFLLPWEKTCVEGTIDCLYQNAAGAWTVLDYKTDRVEGDALKKRAEEHMEQLKFYGAACLKILNITEIRLELYFLAAQKTQEQIFTSKDAGEFLQSRWQTLLSR